MDIFVRKQVFESNSSSNHALHSEPDDAIDANTSKATLRGGVINVTLRSFGQEWMRYYTLENKIAYLLVQACWIDKESDVKNWATHLRQESPKAKKLLDLVEKVTRCKVNVELGNAGFAWIEPDQRGVGHELFDSPDDLKMFLFSAKSYVQTRYDLGFMEYIDTDRGDSERYYESHYAKEAAGEDEFTLKFDNGFNAIEFDSEMMSLYADIEEHGEQRDLMDSLRDVVIVGAKAYYERPNGSYHGIEDLHQHMAEINETKHGNIKILEGLEVDFESERPQDAEKRPAGYIIQCRAPSKTVERITDVTLDLASRGNVIR